MQFPQPTRPIGSFDANSESFLHDERCLDHKSHDYGIHQFSQQPLYPPATNNLEYMNGELYITGNNFRQPLYPPATTNSKYMNGEPYPTGNYLPEEFLHFQFYNDRNQPEAAEDKDIIEELINIISEWYNKFPESIRRQLNVKKLNEAVTLQKGSARGIQVNELSEKLERFKVRTFGQGQDDIVKDDQTQNSTTK